LLIAAVLTDDAGTATALAAMASDSGHVSICRVFNSQIGPYVAARDLNSSDCDLFFCDFRDWETASAVARAVSAQCPSTAIIGLAAESSAEIERHALALGVELLFLSTITQETFDRAIERATHRVPGGMPENLIAFMPAKAGSGCTTVALNAAGRLRNSLGQRVLLIEGDLQSGTLATLMNRAPEHSLTDVVMMADRLDSSLWNDFIIREKGIDLLPRFPLQERSRLPWLHYHQLLRFLKPRYDAILVDLPEVVEDGRTEFLRHARRVYLVTSPDLPALKLTQERCQALDEQGDDAERVDIVVNRWRKYDLKLPDLQKVLARPVVGIFPDECETIRGAILKGDFVPPGTELGKKILDFARQLAIKPGAMPAVASQP
jgi:Flp pilus assembly CpaE family ATPase